MKQTVIGVTVAVVVLYVFGFLYWGLGPYPTLIWQQAKDDEAAGKALLAYFPQRGTYYVPAFNQDKAVVEARMAKGPAAFVHMLAPHGRPLLDPSIMVGGFVLNVIVIALIATLLQMTSGSLRTYGRRVSFAFLLGLTAAILIDGGDAVWWQIPWPWKLYQGAYSVGFCLLTGLVLAWFIKPSAKSMA